MTTVHCGRCHEDLPLEAFTPSCHYRGAYCKACRRAYRAEYRQRRVLLRDDAWEVAAADPTDARAKWAAIARENARSGSR